jgi:Mce-associated membrane protein
VTDSRRERLRRLAAPILATLLVLSSAWLSWDGSARRDAERAGNEAAQVARESIVAILTYRPDTAEKDLDTAARDRLTGQFLDDYTQLIKTVVVPDAKLKGITAAARVPAAAVMSATADHAVLLAYVDQALAVGKEPPTQTNSSVRVTMEKVDGRWLISGFDPI